MAIFRLDFIVSVSEERNFSRLPAGTETAQYISLQLCCSHFLT